MGNNNGPTSVDCFLLTSLKLLMQEKVGKQQHYKISVVCGHLHSPASPTTDTLPPESVFPFYLHLSVPSTNLQTFGKLSSFLLWHCGFQFSFLVLETHICFWNTRIRIILSAIFHLTVPLATRSCSVLELPVCHSVLFIFLSPIVNCQFCLIVGF